MSKQEFCEQLVLKHGMYLIAFISDLDMEMFLDEYGNDGWTADDVDSFICSIPF